MGNVRQLVLHGECLETALPFVHHQPLLRSLTLQLAEEYEPVLGQLFSRQNCARLCAINMLSNLRLDHLETICFVAPKTLAFSQADRLHRYEEPLDLETFLSQLPKLKNIAFVAYGRSKHPQDLDWRFVVKDFDVPAIPNRSTTKITLAWNSSYRREELLASGEDYLISESEWTLYPKEYEVPWSFPYLSDGVDIDFQRLFSPVSAR